jgi:hypothetical protein
MLFALTNKSALPPANVSDSVFPLTVPRVGPLPCRISPAVPVVAMSPVTSTPSWRSVSVIGDTPYGQVNVPTHDPVTSTDGDFAPSDPVVAQLVSARARMTDANVRMLASLKIPCS